MIAVTEEQKYKNNFVYVKKLRFQKWIEFSTLLFGLYTALIPIDQIMNFSGIGTINRYLGVIVMGSMIITMIVKKRPFILKREDISILIFIPLALASYFWSSNQEVTISETTRLVSLVAFYMVLRNKVYTNSEKSFIKLCNILGGLFVSYYLISTRDQFYNRVFITISNGQWIDPNGLSTSISFGLLFLFDHFFHTKSKKNLIISAFFMLIMLYGMMLTGSRGGMLGLLLGVSIFTILSLKKKIIARSKLIIIVIIILALMVVIEPVFTKYINTTILERMSMSSVIETGGTGRFTIWENAINAAYEKIVLGYGFGVGPYVLDQYYGAFVGTHNVVLYILLGTGVIGLALIVKFLQNIIKTSILKNDILIISMITMVIAFSLSLDYLFNKNLWNVMIYSQIGLGTTELAYSFKQLHLKQG